MNERKEKEMKSYDPREIYIYGEATEKLFNTTEGMSPYGRLFL